MRTGGPVFLLSPAKKVRPGAERGGRLGRGPPGPARRGKRRGFPFSPRGTYLAREGAGEKPPGRPGGRANPGKTRWGPPGWGKRGEKGKREKREAFLSRLRGKIKRGEKVWGKKLKLGFWGKKKREIDWGKILNFLFFGGEKKGDREGKKTPQSIGRTGGANPGEKGPGAFRGGGRLKKGAHSGTWPGEGGRGPGPPWAPGKRKEGVWGGNGPRAPGRVFKIFPKKNNL